MTPKLSDVVRETILRALQEHGGNRDHAAKALGISERGLRYKLARYRREGHQIPENENQPPNRGKLMDTPW